MVPLLQFAVLLLSGAEGEEVTSVLIERGNLSVLFRDNSESPKILSGVQSLFNIKDAAGFDAYDPDGAGASAGLNFEHIISGHESRFNAFTPRKGAYTLQRLAGGRSVVLQRRRSASPWAVSSTLKYTVRGPHYIDVDFRCVPHDAGLFGERGHAIFFFANYMNDVEDVGLNFLGIDRAGGKEGWIRADGPPGHPDWRRGGTYRHLKAGDLGYDDDQKFRLNNWSYDYPRFTQPFYYGRAARGMVFLILFDRAYSEEDEVRFSIFKFKLPRKPRPAWDFQYVIHKVKSGKEYGFRARVVWKKFVSREDCLNEYRRWKALSRER